MKGEKLRILIFEKDQNISTLLSNLLTFFEHDVITYTDPTLCKLYTTSQCDCTQDSPCADVIFINSQLTEMDGLDFLRRQRTRGCKAPSQNVAIIGPEMNGPQATVAKELGCRFFKYPLFSRDIINWLNECMTGKMKAFAQG